LCLSFSCEHYLSPSRDCEFRSSTFPHATGRKLTRSFFWETTYTFDSDFKESKLGHGNSLYDDFTYDHRFLITGKWYFRLGVEYERYDFGGTDNGLPDHLQAVYGHLALEYVVKDHAGAGIEFDPGVYFQDNVSGDAFDIPIKAFVTFPLKKTKSLRWSVWDGRCTKTRRSRRAEASSGYSVTTAPSGRLSETGTGLPAK
jgi:hypothetical protein